MAENKKRRGRKCLAAVLLVGLLGGIGNYYINPLRKSAAVGQEFVLSDNCPASLWDYVTVSDGAWQSRITESLNAGSEPGELNLSLKLFGLIPLKQVSIAVQPQQYLYPGGQSIGILLRTEGVLTVGFSPIVTQDGKKLNLAEKAGIEVGDVILRINGQAVGSDDSLAEMINELGEKSEELVLQIDRAGKTKNIKLKPAFCKESGKWRIGLLVRDNAGGIGTLSFVDKDGSYGALGHMVAESNTGGRLNISAGKLVHTAINGVRKGERGNPGEKLGSFMSNQAVGNIIENTDCGIFGKISDWNLIKENIITQPLPVGFCSEIQYNEAEILTVIDGDNVEAFSVEILKVMPNGKKGKELVLKVTDARLLEKTGGIVQGMSGSPIIQNGKIIGAVTYVFVNDPTKGYGILIEDMLAKIN